VKFKLKFSSRRTNTLGIITSLKDDLGKEKVACTFFKPGDEIR
jgi:hypothetical protein